MKNIQSSLVFEKNIHVYLQTCSKATDNVENCIALKILYSSLSEAGGGLHNDVDQIRVKAICISLYTKSERHQSICFFSRQLRVNSRAVCALCLWYENSSGISNFWIYNYQYSA